MIFAVIVVVNVVSDRFFFRIDLTADQRYTLSNATENILENLDEPVTVTAYFTEDLPANLIKTRRDFKDLLVEYNNASGGKVVYEFIDPAEDQQLEQKAMQSGVQPILVSAREKDQVKQQKAYLGAVLQKGDQADAIPVIQPGAAMEYALSSAIKKMSVSVKPRVGFVTGHGEPSLAAYRQAYEPLNVLYQVEELDLDRAGNINDFETLVINGPTDTIPEEHFRILDEFLAGGGKLYIGYNKVEGNMNQARGSSINSNFEDWLSEKGITIDNAFIVDANCITVGVRQQQGNMTFTTPMQFPYIPKTSSFVEHPITRGLEEVMLPFVSPVNYTGDTAGIKFKPILLSSENSGTLTPPLMFSVDKRWTKSDFPLDNLSMGAVVEGDVVGGGNFSKMVVMGDADFAVSGEGQQAQRLGEDNVNLMVNAIDWLSDDTGLIELRTKGVTSRPLDQVEDAEKALLKWMNFLLPIILIIIYGIIRMQRNRNLRTKRMEEDYV